MRRLTRTFVPDLAVLAVFVAILIWPLFSLVYLDNWSSIESTFIADGRFLADHWPKPLWQPHWYGGTRFDYIYPPALRYGTAGLSRLLGTPTAHAYHIYIALMYIFGIGGAAWLAWTGLRSRPAAWFTGLAVACVSPIYILLPHYIHGAVPNLEPHRLSVLMRYGEGPHMSALACLPWALGSAWLALRYRHAGWLSVAAVMAALVVSNNFYGALALAMSFPFLVWAVWMVEGDRQVWIRSVVLGLLAYGLTAFWLTPSYIRITVENLRLVAQPGNRWSIWVALAYVLLYGVVSWWWARRRPDRVFTAFLAGVTGYFALDVMGSYYFGYRVAGEPSRLAPELDLWVVLSTAAALVWLSRRPKTNRWIPVAAGAVVFLGALPYFNNPRNLFWPYPDPKQRIEYQWTEWLARNTPDDRVNVAGSIRFWYNTWFDITQLGGGSEQGLINPLTVQAQIETNLGQDPQLAILWMQCLGTDSVLVNYPDSAEIYHDFQFPKKFERHLEVIRDDGKGNILYRIPRKAPGLARVVERDRIMALPAMSYLSQPDILPAYAGQVESPSAPAASSHWIGVDQLRVKARLEPGQAVVVMESYDPAWHAYREGAALRILRDPLGQMLVEAPAGESEIVLRFETPLENRVGAGISGLSAVLILILIYSAMRRKSLA